MNDPWFICMDGLAALYVLTWYCPAGLEADDTAAFLDEFTFSLGLFKVKSPLWTLVTVLATVECSEDSI